MVKQVCPEMCGGVRFMDYIGRSEEIWQIIWTT